MQVLKKIYFGFLLFLVGCTTTRPETERSRIEDTYTDIGEITLSTSDSFRVGMLLPLSGAAKKQGEGLKNAALMAIDDLKNPNLIVQFYDTQSTSSGARIAAANAFNQKVKLILGPLTSEESSAIAPEAKMRGIPLVSFSTSTDFLQPGVYTLGLLVDEQVNRIISHAAADGRTRLALLLPDNKTGIAVGRAAIRAAENNGMQISRIAYYPPNTSDFSDILRKMTSYTGQTGSYEAHNNIDFDSVLIPEYGAKLTSAISMFGYYDVFSPRVLFLGTSVWENSALNHETALRGSRYPAMSRSYSNYFVNKYAANFRENPSSLYSLAYDAVALSSALSKNREQNLEDALTDSGGYAGMNGVFRLFKNGENQHSLDIMEIRANGNVVIDPAPKRFESNDVFYEDRSSYAYPTVRPRIYGKNQDTAYQELFGYIQ